MVFYIEPPRGRLALARLEKFAKARLHFLLKIARCRGNSIDIQDIVMDSESVLAADCLIEGSSKDATSHFILRLACACNAGMSDFFIESETSFFNYRVSCMTEEELLLYVVTPLQNLHHHLLTKKHIFSQPLADILDILEHMTVCCDLESLVKWFVKGNEGAGFTLPFVHVLRLVAARSVVMQRGVASVPCSKICDVLQTIYDKLLVHGLKEAKEVSQKIKLEDRRIKALFLQLERIFYQNYERSAVMPSPLGVVSADEVDRCVDVFPLCMSNLHHRLRHQHRLKHHDRIQYTLYLKELGMPVHEALRFWRNEYSQPEGWENCGHSWMKEARRYTYNIRHLYGLEGARVNYRGHSCSSLQERVLSSQEIGGCPFANCDQASLSSILNTEEISTQAQQQILSLAEGGKTVSACQVYQREKLKLILDNEGLGHRLQNGCGDNSCLNSLKIEGNHINNICSPSKMMIPRTLQPPGLGEGGSSEKSKLSENIDQAKNISYSKLPRCDEDINRGHRDFSSSVMAINSPMIIRKRSNRESLYDSDIPTKQSKVETSPARPVPSLNQETKAKNEPVFDSYNEGGNSNNFKVIVIKPESDLPVHARREPDCYTPSITIHENLLREGSNGIEVADNLGKYGPKTEKSQLSSPNPYPTDTSSMMGGQSIIASTKMTPIKVQQGREMLRTQGMEKKLKWFHSSGVNSRLKCEPVGADHHETLEVKQESVTPTKFEINIIGQMNNSCAKVPTPSSVTSKYNIKTSQESFSPSKASSSERKTCRENTEEEKYQIPSNRREGTFSSSFLRDEDYGRDNIHSLWALPSGDRIKDECCSYSENPGENTEKERIVPTTRFTNKGAQCNGNPHASSLTSGRGPEDGAFVKPSGYSFSFMALLEGLRNVEKM